MTWDEPEGPVKSRRVIMESTSIYEVWIDDWDDEGLDVLVKREIDSGDAYEHVTHLTPIGGDFVVRKPHEWESHDGERHGPWQVCPFPSCTRVSYPGYDVDPTCWQHEVRGCSRRNLPEKTEWT